MDKSYKKNHSSGKVLIGFILLIVGILSLIKTLGFYIPGWMTSWPMLLILIGVYSGLRNRFRHPASLILILTGAAFLPDKIFPYNDFHNFIWPLLIIVLGIYLIIGKNRGCGGMYNRPKNLGGAAPEEPETADTEPAASNEDYLDTVSVFGGVKKNVESCNFRGGDIVTVMGGAEINLSQADFNGTIILEVTQIFGGTKIIIPPHWKVSSEMVAVFGGIEDKRMIGGISSAQSDKLLIIKGTSIFGGVTIRSF